MPAVSEVFPVKRYRDLPVLASKAVSTFLNKKNWFSDVADIAKRNALPGTRIFLLGSIVYKPIISEVLDIPLEESEIIDVDILLEHNSEQQEWNFPRGWNIRGTGFGNFRLNREYLIGDKVQLDVNNVHDYASTGRSPNEHTRVVSRISIPDYSVKNIGKYVRKNNLESVLEGSPFNVQTVAYDIESEKVIFLDSPSAEKMEPSYGANYLDSIESQLLEINCFDEAIWDAISKGYVKVSGRLSTVQSSSSFFAQFSRYMQDKARKLKFKYMMPNGEVWAPVKKRNGKVVYELLTRSHRQLASFAHE